jgi:hypothetical protein
VPAVTQWWIALHLPIFRHRPDACVFITAILIIDLTVYVVVFSKKRYQWIMAHFNSYDLTKRSAVPVIFLVFPLVLISMFAVLASHINPILPNVVIWSIIIFTELVFRSWWHLWSKQNAQSESIR